jgi:excisionase family DNA binding protein
MKLELQSHDRLLAHRVEQAAQLVGVGRTLIYDEIREGRLRIRKVGRRTLILHSDLQAWLDQLPIRESLRKPHASKTQNLGGRE